MLQVIKRRSSVVAALERMRVFLPFEDLDRTGIGWDEYQEIKLIVYSANFKGKEYIDLKDLKERSEM